VDLVPRRVLEPCPRGVTEVKRQVLDNKVIICCSPGVASESVVLEPHTRVGVPVIPRYVGQDVEARGEPRILDALTKSPLTSLVRDPLRSRSSSLSWRRPRPQSSWWCERLSRWLSTLSARRRASMVFRVSRLGPRQLLTTYAAAPPPSLSSRC
jgi:hypothetical protein